MYRYKKLANYGLLDISDLNIDKDGESIASDNRQFH